MTRSTYSYIREPSAMIGALALCAALACGSSQSEVKMRGGETDLALLAGDWAGTYTGHESGRSGNIEFSLGVGRHTAEGSVTMYPPGVDPADPSAQGQQLRIEFVGIENDQLSGKMDPYTDPQCNCIVETTFVGTSSGDSITGTFETRPQGSDAVQGGTWAVTRK